MKIDIRTSDERSRRRRWNRIQSEENQASLWLECDTALRGTVVDESFGGLGLIFDEGPPVGIGQELEACYNGVQLWGIVRYLGVTDSGQYRLGLEWKAVGLANEVRDANVPGRCEADGLQEFRRLLPGGLCTMWQSFESEAWFELSAMADRLQRGAADAGVRQLIPHTERLKKLTEESVSKHDVAQGLRDLIDECLQLVTGSGTE